MIIELREVQFFSEIKRVISTSTKSLRIPECFSLLKESCSYNGDDLFNNQEKQPLIEKKNLLHTRVNKDWKKEATVSFQNCARPRRKRSQPGNFYCINRLSMFTGKNKRKQSKQKTRTRKNEKNLHYLHYALTKPPILNRNSVGKKFSAVIKPTYILPLILLVA